jgi:hypothetical protein
LAIRINPVVPFFLTFSKLFFLGIILPALIQASNGFISERRLVASGHILRVVCPVCDSLHAFDHLLIGSDVDANPHREFLKVLIRDLIQACRGVPWTRDGLAHGQSVTAFIGSILNRFHAIQSIAGVFHMIKTAKPCGKGIKSRARNQSEASRFLWLIKLRADFLRRSGLQAPCSARE